MVRFHMSLVTGRWFGRIPSILVITSVLLSCFPSNLQLENILSFKQAAAEDSQTTTTAMSKVHQEKVAFPTEDGVSIAGTYYFPLLQESEGSKNETSSALPAAILLHMLGKDRNSWNGFPETLAQNGFVVLAIDLRGHGESVVQNGKPISYQSFTSEDFNKMSLDVKAAKQ